MVDLTSLLSCRSAKLLSGGIRVCQALPGRNPESPTDVSSGGGFKFNLSPTGTTDDAASGVDESSDECMSIA